MRLVKGLLVLVAAVLLVGCATGVTLSPFAPKYHPPDLREGYKQKVENLLVLFDHSASMRGCYFSTAKIDMAKNTVANMMVSLPPDIRLDAGLRDFGPASSSNVLAPYSKLLIAMAPLDRELMTSTVQGLRTWGMSPVAVPIIASKGDLQNVQGRIAVILISDGLNNGSGDALSAVQALRDVYGDRLCLSTISVGDDPVGNKFMKDIATAGGCGYASGAVTLESGELMADFVRRVFYERGGLAVVAIDRVQFPDVVQKQPVVEYEVSPQVVSVELDVEFDFDKAEVKSEYRYLLKDFAEFMQASPEVTAVLEGHTDSVGSAKYNLDLSFRRAESVRGYLINNFQIESSRLAVEGYGLTRPIASNTNVSGRQKNRRVVAVVDKGPDL